MRTRGCGCASRSELCLCRTASVSAGPRAEPPPRRHHPPSPRSLGTCPLRSFMAADNTRSNVEIGNDLQWIGTCAKSVYIVRLRIVRPNDGKINGRRWHCHRTASAAMPPMPPAAASFATDAATPISYVRGEFFPGTSPNFRQLRLSHRQPAVDEHGGLHNSAVVRRHGCARLSAFFTATSMVKLEMVCAAARDAPILSS